MGRGAGRRLADGPASARDRQRRLRRLANRVGHEDEPGTQGITFFGRSFIADPFGRMLADAGEGEEILIARCDPGDASKTSAATGHSCATAASMPTADPQQVSRLVTRRGYRMPAEWEPHRATWISWPHHEPDWPGKLGAIPWVYAEIARVLARRTSRWRSSATTNGCLVTPVRCSTRTACLPIAGRCTSSQPIASGSAIRHRSACTMRRARSSFCPGRSTGGRSTTIGEQDIRIARPDRAAAGRARLEEPRRDGHG